MKYFLIAGEASGDLHASHLMQSLTKLDPRAEFAFLGGDRMAAVAGKRALHHYRGMNFMGIVDVLKNLRTLSRIYADTKKQMLFFEPDLVILVDYAGFNLKVARFASKNGFRTAYYILPKVWAWRKRRIRKLKAYLDHFFAILPFEVPFYQEHGLKVMYHGNPLMDQMERFRKEASDKNTFLADNELDERPIVALLAGSRSQEIKACLPEMIAAAAAFPSYQFVVAGAPSVEAALYEKYLLNTGIKIVYDATYPLLTNAHTAVVTSGTATLETALFNVPQVVIYKTHNLTYRIAKLFLNFRFFSLVNLIYGDEAVKELLQVGLAEKIRTELNLLLEEEDYRQKIQESYAKIKTLLGGPGASERIAAEIQTILR